MRIFDTGDGALFLEEIRGLKDLLTDGMAGLRRMQGIKIPSTRMCVGFFLKKVHLIFITSVSKCMTFWTLTVSNVQL